MTQNTSNKIFKSSMTLLFILAFCIFGHAQFGLAIFQKSSPIQKANNTFNKGNYAKAVQQFNEVLKYEEANVFANYKIGVAYLYLNNYGETVRYFAKVQNNYADSSSFIQMYLFALKACGRYEDAITVYDSYHKRHSNDKEVNYIGEHIINNDLHFSTKQKWTINPTILNTQYREFSPVIKDSLLYFISSKPYKRKAFRKFFYKKLNDINSASIVNLYKIDTNLIKNSDSGTYAKSIAWKHGNKNIGPVTITKDSLIYYTINNAPHKGISTLGIRYSKLINDKIEKSTSFKFNSKIYSVEHPTISSNGRFLYFVSDMPGGKGGFDIYYCTLLDSNTQTWSDPVNIGVQVNSKGNEGFPYVQGDSVLYFSSDYWPGFGGLDIFKVNLKNGLPITNPINLGYPLNSNADDFGITYTSNPTKGYFSSNRKNYNDDIYSFESLNSKDDLIDSAELLKNKLRNDSLFNVYLLNRSKDSIRYADSVNNELNKLLKYVIFYDFDKYILNNKSIKVLDTLISILKANPNLNIIMGSFTDKFGPFAYNLQLSAKRSHAVLNYLAKHGITTDRITENHYGTKYQLSNKTLNANSKSKEILNSRRTEFYLTQQKNKNWLDIHNDSLATTSKMAIDKVMVINKPKDTIKPVVAKPVVVKPVVTTKPVVIKDTIRKVIAVVAPSSPSKPKVVIVDTIKPVVAKPVVVKPVVTTKPVVIKDTIRKVIAVVAPSKPKVVIVDSVAILKHIADSVKKQKELDRAAAIKLKEENDQADLELRQAFESLSKLKKEQERIINYLTKRVNKKPIYIYTTSDSVSVELYDSGVPDNDSVSVIFRKQIVVDKQVLNPSKPIKFWVKLDNNINNNEIIIVAESVGLYPPNTALMVINDKFNHRQEVFLNTDLTQNQAVYFVKIGKESSKQ
jgi:outer membrane protein OmpA-like peptidoglycan-associated protein